MITKSTFSRKKNSPLKCSAAVVGLDLLLGLSMVRRCSLNRSFKRLSSPNHTDKRQVINPHRKFFFLIQKGRTINPDRLNIREETC